MICLGQHGLGVELNLTGTEQFTVGYVGRTFLYGVARRVAGFWMPHAATRSLLL